MSLPANPLCHPEHHLRTLRRPVHRCGSLPPPCVSLLTPFLALCAAAAFVPPPLHGTCVPPAATCGPPPPPPMYPVRCSLRTASAHLQTASAAAYGPLLPPCASLAEPQPPCTSLRTPSATLCAAAACIPSPLHGTCVPPAAAYGPPPLPPMYLVRCILRTASAACRLPPPPPVDPFCRPVHHLWNLRCPACPVTPPFSAHQLQTLRHPAAA